jgi:anti-sigma B factor antagonist
VRVKCEEIGAALVCHLQGNLEQLSVPQFREAVAGLPSKKLVIFELSAVPFVDSAGIGALIGAVRRIREFGGDAVLCSPRPSISRVFLLVGLARVVTVAASTSEATEHWPSTVVA